MNALGLPGASIDGILGFTILARFRIELDLTKDRMIWTRLDFEPSDPPVPPPRSDGRPPAEMQAMNALGPLAKVAALPDGQAARGAAPSPRASSGLELAEAERPPSASRGSWPTPRPPGPASSPGDLLVRLGDHGVATLSAARKAVAEVRAGNDVALLVAASGGDDPRLDR